MVQNMTFNSCGLRVVLGKLILSNDEENPMIISTTQKENIQKLIADLDSSIDTAPSETSLDEFKEDLQVVFADGKLDSTELKTLANDVIEIVESTGVTASEARTIFYDLQNIGESSRLPRTDDNLTGTSGNDILWGELGNDTITGATTDDAGVDDIDILIGGGGKDTFVLGNATTVFYDDSKKASAGLNDYGLILDFNRSEDVIQLHGDASNYSLGVLPDSLGLTGTAIYHKSASSGQSVPELIGVILGVNVTDLNSGFSFV